MTRAILISSLLLSLALAGCSGEEPKAPQLPQVPKGTAKVTGTVTLVGTPPPMTTQVVSCDPRPEAAKMSHTDRTVRASATGGLADVYVFVKNGPKGSGAGEPPALLDQKECAFEPQALAVQVGQPLRIRNSDPTFHNVHWDPTLNRAENIGFAPAPVAERVIALATAEFLAVRCDVHPWMKGTIAVFDNPYFAVTDEAGNFTLTNLPPGAYTLTTWHAFYHTGEEKQITVSENGSVSADFTYKSP